MDQGIVNPTPFQNRGFTLVELLLVVAITSIITAVGLPVYRGYVETAYMSKVNAAYENAIRLTRQEFSKNTTKISLGLASTMPVNDASWIDKFDKGGLATAPGGGPAYLRHSEIKKEEASVTGTVIVKWDAKKQQMEIVRPAYLSLIQFTVKITPDSIKIEKKKEG